MISVIGPIVHEMWLFFSTEDDQEGVMDNLLEALKTGSAFNVNRERKDVRKRTPRAAGGM
jgi:diaphanous 2